jgi:hypothetical protein
MWGGVANRATSPRSITSHIKDMVDRAKSHTLAAFDQRHRLIIA